ncbi:hypothetical protein Tco_0963992 [Tanacetum coccineum]
MSLRTTVLGQMSEIRELHAADHRRQAMISEMMKAYQRRSAEMRELRTANHTRHQHLIQTLTVMQSLQGHVTTLQGQAVYEESDKIERYVSGCPTLINGNIVQSKPKTMQEAVEMATELMDKKVSTIAERQAENKRKAGGKEAIRGLNPYALMELVDIVKKTLEFGAQRVEYGEETQPFRWRCFLLDIVPKETVTYLRCVSSAKERNKKTNEDGGDELDNVKTYGGCLKGDSENSGGKRLAISMVEEAWLSEKEDV